MKATLGIEDIRRAALDLGFSACGVSVAEAVDSQTAAYFRSWIAGGNHATMHYLAENVDKRLDPRLLMPEVKTIVSVALGYSPFDLRIDDLRFTIQASTTADEAEVDRIVNRKSSIRNSNIALYALGTDYHDVMKAKLHRLAATIGAENYRAFCDTAPVLERYWAVRAGIGFIGRNHQLIVPRAGSMFFLGELFLSEEVEVKCEDGLARSSQFNTTGEGCGSCRACIDACPTNALNAGIDCRLCLSYHTIENRGDIPAGIAEHIGECFYGCDRCTLACPHNRFAVSTAEPLLQPREDILAMTAGDWLALTPEQYRRLFRGSAVKRAKYDGLMRNISLSALAMKTE